jgi:DNA polymerase IIIc chi subunit
MALLLYSTSLQQSDNHMPASVTFIISQATTRQACLHEICHLITHSYKQQKHIQILCAHINEQQLLSQQLWSYAEHAFVPSTTDEEKFISQSVVLLSTGEHANINTNMIINLNQQPVANAQQHENIVEWVTTDPQDKLQRRKNYKFYQNLNISVASKNIEETLATNAHATSN